MAQILNTLVIIIMLLTIPYSSNGQYQPSKNAAQLNFGLSGGITQYYGDLNSSITGVGEFGTRFTFESLYSFKLNLRGGQLKGDKSDAGGFENDYFQTGLNFGFNFSKFTRMYRSIPKLNLIPYIGAAAVFNDSKKISEGENSNFLKEYKGTNVIYPVGLNIKYYLSPYFDLKLDANFHITTTDKLDSYFVDYNTNQANDYFGTVTLGISYKLLTKDQKDHTDWKPRP